MAAQAQHKEVADGECLLLIQVSVGYSKTHFCDMWPGARARAGLVSFICALSVPGYLFNDTVILFFFFNIYLFGCTGSELQHVGSSLPCVRSSLPHAGSFSCSMWVLSCDM